MIPFLNKLTQADPAFLQDLEQLDAADVPSAIDAIGQLLNTAETDLPVRQQAVLALRQLGRASATPYLGQALTRDASPVIRRLSTAALEQIDLQGGLPYFQEAMSDSDTAVQKAAAYALGTAVDTLVAQLSGADALADQEARNILANVGYATLGHVLTHDNRETVRQAAANALSLLGGAEAVTYLCAAFDRDEEEPGVLWTVVSALITVGTEGENTAVVCLGTQLRDHENYRLRTRVAGALQQIGHTAAIPYLVEALVQDERDSVRTASAEALASLPNWEAKATQLLDVLSSSRRERAAFDFVAIVQAIRPTREELADNRHLLTDFLIRRAVVLRPDSRLAAIMAGLIIASADGSLSLAGERVNLYQRENQISESDLQTLRIEIGGATALNPILLKLEENLQKNFQEPISELNNETRAMWRQVIRNAQLIFGLRTLMSVIVFAVGIYLVIGSYQQFIQGSLDQVGLFGSGVSFIGGLGLILATVYTGPLKEIRQAVSDFGIANATYIAYVHRILQISHTFTLYYLKEEISFERAKEAGALIEDAANDAMVLLGGLGEKGEGRERKLSTAVDNLLSRDDS